MTDFQKDISLGLMFIIGIFGFISGAFIASAIVFASAAMFSTMFSGRRISG